MSYQYENLCEKGFVRIPVTRRQHNRMLPNRKQKFGAKIEYYWHPEKHIFEAQYFCSAWMKAFLIVIMFLPSIFMQGAPETIREVGNLIHERKRGGFGADRSFLNHGKTTDGELESFIKNHMRRACNE
ncbi:hypothetical protein F6Q07_21920 [Pectobacterium parmentieri]|uniref:hypothetical protein n=1 Tax=Pectobacterium parmentieri TaxID=1905730 RepID=UPI000EACF547|nr:hypothetical protein [Pectobacterium parmentieri]AYH33257.1 hypothetical protein C5E19_17410 [Pectobacterium parmentieri]MBI0520736.1 hypothetical protein [Pectobacterium parmentieri]QQA77040.1 hypothetical protein JBL47_05410 [Pectobacterium parmentieri]